MKAIVLTYDKYRCLTDHMILRYRELWPDHPFVFRIPYQQQAPTLSGDDIAYRETPGDIKSTVLSLLEDLEAEEWIYWCIDDKYPIWIDVPFANTVVDWISNGMDRDTCGVLFCRCRGLKGRRNMTGKKVVDHLGNKYLERANYRQIWIHQFLKVKVLRHLFMAFPDEIPNAKVMDDLKNKMEKPSAHRLLVARRNRAVFGESTTRGKITANCRESMLRNDISLSAWPGEVSDREIIIGQMPKRWF